MISLLLAATLSFTATATGVERGTPVEFFLAGANTDREYETLFILDEPVDQFCKRLEGVGIPRGQPTDQRSCRLWPTGPALTFEPALDTFLTIELPDGLPPVSPIYTGGTRDGQILDAATNMPAAVFALYSLSQAPIVFNGIFDQGVVYGSYKVKKSLKKGEKVSFKILWDETTQTHPLTIDFKPGNSLCCLKSLKEAASKSEVNVLVGFDDEMTVSEATAVAHALATIDSSQVKINGRRPDDFFFRAFLPLVKWRDRKERLTQPFEITVGTPDKVVFIEEDWSGEGIDPKLTEKLISYEQLRDHPHTDTAFFFVKPEMKLMIVKEALKKLPQTVINHYLYVN